MFVLIFVYLDIKTIIVYSSRYIYLGRGLLEKKLRSRFFEQKEKEIYSKQDEKHENLNFPKTGYSNSRLSGQTLGKSQTQIKL